MAIVNFQYGIIQQYINSSKEIQISLEKQQNYSQSNKQRIDLILQDYLTNP